MESNSTLKLSEIVFREDLYPRIKADPSVIQRYSESLEVLPPIEVNQRNELIDGFHRWKAHQKNNLESINVVVTETSSDADLLALAIERNAKHGLQLSQEDKRRMAINIYAATQEKERQARKQSLSSILSVTQRTLNNWLTDIDKATNKARDKRIFSMWLSCSTQEEIAEAVGLSQNQVTEKIKVLSETENFPKPILHAMNYELEDDSPPRYTVWSFGSKTNKVGHFGNSEQTIVDWLVYLYTNPFDIVVDPFGGGGATIDVCQKRMRRYWIGDRKPITERESEIRKHDLLTEDGDINLPDLRGRWGDVKLIYLDPPYWKQAENKYSNDKTDLANVDLETFNSKLTCIIKQFAKKATNAHIAMLMQPTQWKSENHQFIDHVLQIAPQVNLPIETRIQAPYQKASCTPPMNEWASASKKLLVLSREIVVWRAK